MTKANIKIFRMTSLDTNTLLQLFARKCELLMQLRQFGVRQYELIDTSDMNRLLSLLSAKQKLLGEIQNIERQLDPFRHESPESRVWASDEQRRQCAQLAEACQRLLAEVMETEKHGELQLILRRDEAATRLQGVHQAIHARAAYIQPNPASFTQVDLSSE
ncbi:MAG TPA: hypothetical protein VGI75_16425 [Pirellulales bacterium]